MLELESMPTPTQHPAEPNACARVGMAHHEFDCDYFGQRNKPAGGNQRQAASPKLVVINVFDVEKKSANRAQ
jgi:hypothetical protein